MNAASLIILVIISVAILASSRRGALLALMAGSLYITQNQALHVLAVNVFPTRILEVVRLVRVLARREWSLVNVNTIDRAVLWLYAFTTVVFLLRSKDGHAYQIGLAVDSYLIYFLSRSLLASPEDFRWLLRSFVLLLIPYVLIVAMERVMARSPLAFMGWGFGEGWTRDGVLRCFGSFRHPSLLGTLGVSFIPMLVGMAFNPEDRKRAVLGIGLCLVIVWAANSGGPISGVAFGGVAWLCWLIRRKMSRLRWAIVAFIAAAAVLMKAPVWYLIAHVSELTGGDGWHRAYLMDISFQNLGQWWFDGMPIENTADWFPYMLASTNGADITNEFVAFGITSGLGSLALFILVLTRAFSRLGQALRAVREDWPRSDDANRAEFLLWGLGAMLAAHLINWLGITYFDQTYVFWFLQLAAISTLSDWYINNRPVEPSPLTHEAEAGSEMPDLMQITAQ
jgi:hypothetical protein